MRGQPADERRSGRLVAVNCRQDEGYIRALAQRRKGRDLSDLWLARRELRILDSELARAADYYLSAASISPAVFRERLAKHSEDPEFCSDLDALTNLPYEGFSPKAASRELIQCRLP